MINVLSIGCGLQFGTYLAEAADAFARREGDVSRVIRQGGTGLILRSDGEMKIRYQDRESSLTGGEAAHYAATIQFRIEAYDVKRMSDEVVFASFGRSLLLSHPQSDLWLDVETVSRLVQAGRDSSDLNTAGKGLPDWLSISTGGGRLLISDQRTGRWVLLGDDHIAELERRLESLATAEDASALPAAPTINLKGLAVHLQSAFRLAETLAVFADSGEVAGYEDAAPSFSLRVGKATEGIELRDQNYRVALTKNEARKWAAIIRSELERVNAVHMARGRVTTVIADGEQGRWVLQWGDEVFVPDRVGATDSPDMKRAGGFVLLLARATAACVALTEEEVAAGLRAPIFKQSSYVIKAV